MKKKGIMTLAAVVAAGLLLGFAICAGLLVYDRFIEQATPLEDGVALDLSEFGFVMLVPESFSLLDTTQEQGTDADLVRFSGCAFDEDRMIFIYCYENEAQDSIASYSEEELVRYYMGAGADDVRIRVLGGRRFICYRAAVNTEEGAQYWYTYDTWDETLWLKFETQMIPADTLPMLMTISFLDGGETAVEP